LAVAIRNQYSRVELTVPLNIAEGLGKFSKADRNMTILTPPTDPHPMLFGFWNLPLIRI
jgi:hypothetical protein